MAPQPQTTLAFTCWIQSVAYYVACKFQATQAFLRQAQAVYSKLVLKRVWIAASNAHPMLRSLKIARGPEIEQAMITSFIGFALRRYDGASLIGLAEGNKPSCSARFVSLLKGLKPHLPQHIWERLHDNVAAYKRSQHGNRNRLLQLI